MNCHRVRALLSRYLDEDLNPHLRGQVQAHLDSCEDCRRELFDLRESLRPLREMPSEDPGPEFNERVMRSYNREINCPAPASLGFRLALGAAALLVLLLIGIPVYVANLDHFTGNQEVYVIGTDTLIPGSRASMRVIVARGDVSAPVEDAYVTLALYSKSGGVRLMSGRTDDAGTLSGSFDVPADLAGTARLIATAKSSEGRDTLEVPVELKRSVKVMLTTDKQIYQPGQVIHLRTLALLRPSLKPAAGDEMHFIIRDPKGNKVFDDAVPTSDWGVSSADFQLADEVNIGTYTVRAELGDSETEKTVEVKRYVLPKFKVSLETDRSFYLPGQTVRGTVTARYFFGKPVAGGAVNVDLSGLNVDFDRFSTIKGRTNADGVFEFTARVPKLMVGQPTFGGNAKMRIDASVKDTAQHTEEIGREAPVASQPVRMAVVPESGELAPGLENVVYVVTSYPDGRPAPASVTMEYRGNVQRAKSDSLGVSVFRMVPEGNEVTLRLTAVTPQGERASGPSTLYSSPLSISADRGLRNSDVTGIRAANSLPKILIRSDKGVYDVGDTANIVVLTTAKTSAVYVDAVMDGQTLLTRTAHLSNGRAGLAMDLGNDFAGTVTFSAYVLSPLGVPVRDTATVLVRQANDLTVQVRSDKDTYRPGERAKIDLRVTDRSGHGVAAAVGVNVVDESVYSVQAQMPGLAALYFALQKDILKPRYQTEFFSEDEDFNELTYRDSQAARILQQSALRPRLQTRGELPGWTESDSVLADENERDVQRAAKVLFASALDPYRTTIAAVTDTEKQNRTTVLQHRLEWLTPVAVVFLLFAVPAAVLAFTRRIRRAIVVIVVALAFGCAVMIAALQGASIPPVVFGVVFVLWLWSLILAVRGAAGWAEVAVVLVVVGIVIAMVFPIFARAREAARKSTAQGNLREAGVAMGAYWDAFGPTDSLPVAAPLRRFDAKLLKMSDGSVSQKQVRVRQLFPETLYVNPQVITDDFGRGSFELDAADSITTWRLSAIASSKNGQIGSATARVRVFQDFFVDLDLPVGLTQGDDVFVPVAVYNYLPTPQTVRLALKSEPWFESLGDVKKVASLGPNEVSVVHFPIRALRLGRHALTVRGDSGSTADAVRRGVTIYPNGQMRTAGAGGVVSAHGSRAFIDIPSYAIPGSATVMVKIYPGALSQVVDGLEALLGVPCGCFEQTSSVTYPNVLVLEYLKALGKNDPKVSMKAEQYISLGYQRLLTFEVPGGGFDWYGNAPANTILTAYGIMELADMAEVFPVDQGLIRRAKQLLDGRQNDDGSWDPGASAHTWGAIDSKLPVTAYVAWALAEGGYDKDRTTARACDYLRKHLSEINDSYVLALAANALVAADHPNAGGLLNRLADAALVSGDKANWKSSAQTLTYGYGDVAGTETTALAAYAFIRSHTHPDRARQALNALIDVRDPRGSWGTTQATILALKALLAGSTEGIGGSGDVTVMVNGAAAGTVRLSGSETEVVRTLNVTGQASAGRNVIELRTTGDARPAYLVTAGYYVPWDRAASAGSGDMKIDVRYGKLQVERDGVVELTANVRATKRTVRMAIVDLGVPPGFAVVSEDLEALRSKRAIDRYEITPRQIVLYMRNIGVGGVTVRCRLKALYPVRATSPASHAYDYYNPESSRTEARPVVVRVI